MVKYVPDFQTGSFSKLPVCLFKYFSSSHVLCKVYVLRNWIILNSYCFWQNGIKNEKIEKIIEKMWCV